MSVKVMGQVWDLDLPHNQLLVLLAMADHADHDGKHVHPSIELLAWKTGYEERQVRRIIRTLEHAKLLVVEKAGGGRQKTTEYSIHLANGVKKSPFKGKADILTGNNEKGGHFDRESEVKADILPPFPEETRTSEAQNPDIAMSPEPSLEPKPKTEENSLTTFESLPDAESVALPSVLPTPHRNGLAVAAKPMKGPKPLAEDDWLRALLLEYDTLHFASLNDDAWWVDVSQPLAGVFGKDWLNAELGKVSAYLRENPRKKPASSSGWKRFMRSWLHRAYEHQRRYATNGTPNRYKR